jgi:hypothetical protein
MFLFIFSEISSTSDKIKPSATSTKDFFGKLSKTKFENLKKNLP